MEHQYIKHIVNSIYILVFIAFQTLSTAHASEMQAPTSLISLMPLTTDGDYDNDRDAATTVRYVTPTHVAVTSGAWNDNQTWSSTINSPALPGKGSVVYVPPGISVNMSGAINSENNAIFMLRIDGTLDMFSDELQDTKLFVDTILSNMDMATGEGGNISIATNNTNRSIDIAITPFDIEGFKSIGAPGWESDTKDYYEDSLDVTGWNGTAVEKDGAGVLGRYSWDGAQLSLGIIAHGKTAIIGDEVSTHAPAINVVEGEMNGQSGIVAFDMNQANTINWHVNHRLLITSTRYSPVTEGNPQKQNIVSNDTTVTISSIENIGNNNIRVHLQRALDPAIYSSRNYEDGSTFYPTLANLTRSINIYSHVALLTDGSISRPDSINNPTIETTAGINGNLQGENGHLVTQRGHIMAMHTDDITIKYASFNGLGRTDKSALIDDFAASALGFERPSGPNEGLLFNQYSGISRQFVDRNENRKFDNRTVDYAEKRALDSVVNQRGRYSIHIHQAGLNESTEDTETELNAAWIEGNVVWGAPGWGIVHHNSEAIIANNITYDVVGSGYIAETGNEVGVWYNNLSATNTGFIDGHIDPPFAHAMNDVGRMGVGFWMEGRNLALLDNLVSSSRIGYVWEPYGVDNIDTTNYGLSRTNTMLKHPELANIVTASGVIIDDMVDKLALISIDGIASKNTNVPIRYFQGNSVGASEKALRITTDPGLAARKFNDVWSIFRDFNSWETQFGMHFNYTSKYLLENINFYGLTNSSLATEAIDLTAGTSDFVLVDVKKYSGARDIDHRTATGSPQKNFSGMKSLKDTLTATQQVEFDAQMARLWQEFTDPGVVFHPYVGGFTDNAFYNPYHNFYNINIFAEDAVYNTGGNTKVNTDFANDGIDLPGIASINRNRGNSALPMRISNSLVETDNNPVTINLVDDNEAFGVVALWREIQRAQWYTNPSLASPLVYVNDFWLRRLQLLERGVFRNLSVFRGNSNHRDKFVSNEFNEDVWSGVLLEFDKLDALGKQRFAYSSTELFSHATHNERHIISKAMINKAINLDGYFTIDSIVYTNKEGIVENMKFVTVPYLFTDRLSGDIHQKTFIVALEEAWGDDGSISFGVPRPFDVDTDTDDSFIISEKYCHYLNGELVNDCNEINSFPERTPIITVDGTTDSDLIDSTYIDWGGDSISDGREIVLAGDGEKDRVYGSYGADKLDGGAGTNDRVHYHLSPEAIHIDLAAETQLGGYAEGDTLLNLEVYNLSYLDDTFLGSEDGEFVWPHEGYDIVRTLGGDDSIRIIEPSGIFNDYIDAGTGYDSISFKGVIPYTVNLTHDRNASVNIVDAEYISGHQVDDRFFITDTTNSGAQRYLQGLSGNGGDDELNVTLRRITLIGYSGADTFNINHESYAFTNDMEITIEDFDVASDTLKWRGNVIDVLNITDPQISVVNVSNPLILQLGTDGTVILESVSTE